MYAPFRNTFIEDELSLKRYGRDTDVPFTSFGNRHGVRLSLGAKQERFASQPSASCDKFYHLANHSMAFQSYRSLWGSTVSGSTSRRSEVRRLTRPLYLLKYLPCVIVRFTCSSSYSLRRNESDLEVTILPSAQLSRNKGSSSSSSSTRHRQRLAPNLQQGGEKTRHYRNGSSCSRCKLQRLKQPKLERC